MENSRTGSGDSLDDSDVDALRSPQAERHGHLENQYAQVDERMIGIWHAATLGLASIVVTGAVAWFTFGNETVTTTQMEAFVTKEIRTERTLLEVTTKSLDNLSDKLDAFVKEQSAYRIQQAETNGELSALVSELRRARENGGGT